MVVCHRVGKSTPWRIASLQFWTRLEGLMEAVIEDSSHVQLIQINYNWI